MAKKLSVAIGSYEKDGQQKTRWQNIGVIMEKDGREYALLDPTVNLGAVLTIQNMEAHKQGKKTSDRIMCGVFVEQEASGYQNQPNPTYQPAQPRQPQQPSNPPPSTEFDDLDIPF